MFHRITLEVTARTVKFLGRRDNGGVPVGEPPPGAENALQAAPSP